MDENLEKYREDLVSAKRESRNSLDKYLMSLSSGIFGFSIVFVKEALKDSAIVCESLLFTSWLFFVLTILFTTISFWFSEKAHVKAIKQVDSNTIYDETTGGCWVTLLKITNSISFFSFVIGLIIFIIFISQNF